MDRMFELLQSSTDSSKLSHVLSWCCCCFVCLHRDDHLSTAAESNLCTDPGLHGSASHRCFQCVHDAWVVHAGCARGGVSLDVRPCFA